MEDCNGAPDAIVLGITTGGIYTTEELLKSGNGNPERYACHAAGSVAEHVARETECNGPVLTIATACSSGATALKIAMDMLRSGTAKSVLAGGADCLCRLTYYGFHSLQLVDPAGARPFDKNRRGMSIGEGAAMLLLTAAETPPDNAIAELLGAGLSCDAWHPAAPHPQGEGALKAMHQALADARLILEEIDYIHLHGTGTVDNDLAEAHAVKALFGDRPIPAVSSTKGIFGHSLAAAGATGAAMAAFGIARGLIPGNIGLNEPDPALNLIPIATTTERPVRAALANAFGFGGNNAVLALGHPKRPAPADAVEANKPVSFSVVGGASLSGAGQTDQIIDRIIRNERAAGLVPPAEMARHLSERYARRMKRLPRLTLTLAISASGNPADGDQPASVFFGTGWGGLSETHDFLKKLFESEEKFTSPTDFIGSVHNAAAGLTAIHFKAKGANITTTGGNCSFEQALMSAGLVSSQNDDPLLVIGADEYHPVLSPLFDSSVALSRTPADGGGALFLRPDGPDAGCRIRTIHLAYNGNCDPDLQRLIQKLGGPQRICDQYGAILVGIPLAERNQAELQLASFLERTSYPHRVIDYRRFTGEFASASAVAAVLAVSFVQSNSIPDQLTNCMDGLQGLGVLVLGLGNYLTAMDVMP
jgi:3-oxoacyl-[acyl-carrier-protein] synthase-1/3-oxoacyl-[acyl-carrier-protein] synthase II